MSFFRYRSRPGTAAHGTRGVGCKRWPWEKSERFSVRLGPARTLLYLYFAGRRLIRSEVRGVCVRPVARRVCFTGVLHYWRNRGNRQIGTRTRTTTNRSGSGTGFLSRIVVPTSSHGHGTSFPLKHRDVETRRRHTPHGKHAFKPKGTYRERVGISYDKADSA